MNPLLLRVNDLSISYPGLRRSDAAITVIQGLSFAVVAGKLCCLSGRSGSGKTSLITHLSGVALPPQGSVWWGDHDVATMTDAQLAQLRLAHVGYLDQDSALIDELTCLENVLLPIIPHGKSQIRRGRRRALDYLEQLGLKGWENAYPHQISGGMRQRVGLAQLLTAQTPVILADEPTASLDRSWADVVISILKDHTARGGIVIAASHDPQLTKAADIVIEIEG